MPAEKVGSHRTCKHQHLWLVTPNHPEELKLVWLVLGETPDDPMGVTIPIHDENRRELIRALTATEILSGRE